eukprot:SAG22_NODE_16355_length_327_cov_0.675439_1_plen_27_part_10
MGVLDAFASELEQERRSSRESTAQQHT